MLLAVYYRIYAEDGAIPSNQSFDNTDPYLGRIKATRVAPPHTVLSVKRRLSKIDGIPDHQLTDLFLTISSQAAMDSSEKVTLLKEPGFGWSRSEPVALVAKLSNEERDTLLSSREVAQYEISDRSSVPETNFSELLSFNAKFYDLNGSFQVHYYLYTEDGDIPSKVSFDSEEPSLGRIRVTNIAPPHNLESFKRCISRAELNPTLIEASVYAQLSSDTPMEDLKQFCLAGTRPGSRVDEPMAVVGSMASLRKVKATRS